MQFDKFWHDIYTYVCVCVYIYMYVYLWSHHHNQDNEHNFHPPKFDYALGNPFQLPSLISLSYSQANNDLLFVTIDQPAFSSIAYKQDTMVQRSPTFLAPGTGFGVGGWFRQWCEWWGVADEVSFAQPLLPSWCVAQFLTDQGPDQGQRFPL